MLEVLLATQGRAVSAEELLERVWDEFADPFTRTVTITLSRLRAKLGDPPLMETVPGPGTGWEDGNESAPQADRDRRPLRPAARRTVRLHRPVQGRRQKRR